jgi:hypothetical protein
VRDEEQDGCQRPISGAARIYMGAKINAQHEARLLEIARKQGIQAYKMELSQTKYKLIAKEIR